MNSDLIRGYYILEMADPEWPVWWLTVFLDNPEDEDEYLTTLEISLN